MIEREGVLNVTPDLIFKYVLTWNIRVHQMGAIDRKELVIHNTTFLTFELHQLSTFSPFFSLSSLNKRILEFHINEVQTT